MENNLDLLIEKVVKLSNNITYDEILRFINADKDIAEIKTFFQTYSFTTENISGYINSFDLKDKSLLTVGSSGDQAINAILKGCKDVTVIDISPFAKYYFYLKKAAILTLNYKEFCEFFCYKYYDGNKYNPQAFNLQSYNKLKDTLKKLDEQSFLFWDTLFSKCNSKNIRRTMFKCDELGLKILKRVNPYLKNRLSFNKTKSKIENINPKFINGDIFKTKLYKTYDNIFLSNIGTYYTQEILKGLVDSLETNLNDEGKLLICYLYDTLEDTPYLKQFPEIYNLDKFYKLFRQYITYFNSFRGVINIRFSDRTIKDSVVIYQKRLGSKCKK